MASKQYFIAAPTFQIRKRFRFFLDPHVVFLSGRCRLPGHRGIYVRRYRCARGYLGGSQYAAFVILTRCICFGIAPAVICQVQFPTFKLSQQAHDPHRIVRFLRYSHCRNHTPFLSAHCTPSFCTTTCFVQNRYILMCINLVYLYYTA